MNAAKHFDPVLGIDIHIIQPPGPVPPLPIPHPFIGMLIDPMEYAPVIGGTVKVNGMMRGVAGTCGKCLPPHIPIGGMFVKPPGNECTVFMGSQTVAFDGDPASRLGMMVLSCHCVGMPAPPRIKPHSKPTSLELPTSVVLPIPAGPPVLIGGPPTITLMGALKMFGPFLRWIQKGSKFAGKFAAISAKLRGAANRVLGPRLGGLANKAICFLTGHPVDVASGQVLTEAVDIELPGPLPFKFERVWYSRSDHRGSLGSGWHHSYDLALTVFPEGVLVRLADGRLAAFDTPERGKPEFNRLEKLFLHRVDDGYDLEDLDGRAHHFGSAGAPGAERPLEHYRDPNGNRIELVRKGGRLLEFIDSGGRHLAVIADAEGRITEIHGPDPAAPGKTFALVSYRYNAEGDLVEARDALGNPFKYQYDRHLLVKETDRVGLSFYFMYDQPGPEARCVKTWGDGNIFLRELTYDVARQRTVAINSLGHATVYEWNDLGVVTKEIDPLGGETFTEWNQFGDKLSVTNQNGEKISCEYDAHGRLLAVTDPTGASIAYEYDAAGNNTTYTDPGMHTWKRSFDSRRNLVASIDPAGGREEFKINSRGLLVEATDAAGHAAKYEWTNSGVLQAIVDRCGGRTKLEYDRLDRVIAYTDAAKSRFEHQYDRRGLLTELTNPAGNSFRLSYGPDGKLNLATDPTGRSVAYSYAAMGRLESMRASSGRLVRYKYDLEGELIEVDGPATQLWTFTRDAGGRVVTERTSDGRRLNYAYDKAGQVVRTTNGRGDKIELRRDPAGRVIERKLPTGVADQFTYSPAGEMTSAVNAMAAVKWGYDGCGRIVSEARDGKELKHSYDAVGNRVARSSPLDQEFKFAYDPEGRLVSVADDFQELFRSSYDLLGRELRRETNSGAAWEWNYNPTGELASVQVSGKTQFQRTYEYDAAGLPIRQNDSTFGLSQYSHDRDGFLTAVEHSNGSRQAYGYDAAGDIIPASDIAVTRNADSHMIERRTARDRWNYTFDPLGRLISAHSDFGLELSFAYDALGRRIRKSCDGIDTEYLWDGDFALGEIGQSSAEYVYRPGTFEPLARFGGETVILECDPIGLPRSALALDGSLAWQAAFEPFGELSEERGSPGLIKLRYPGQLADSETGLLYNWFRYLDPLQRSYISPDPLGLAGGGGVWGYVPSPLLLADPFGLECAPPGQVKVTTWAPNGITPDLNPGRWVMLGGPSRLNYILSGLPGGKFFFGSKWPFVKVASSGTSLANHTTDFIDKSRLAWPPGWEKWKGILGQRVIK